MHSKEQKLDLSKNIVTPKGEASPHTDPEIEKAVRIKAELYKEMNDHLQNRRNSSNSPLLYDTPTQKVKVNNFMTTNREKNMKEK